MEKYKIAVIAGDGIGPEVIEEGKKVLAGIAKMDGSFEVEGVGPIEFITLAASGLAEGAQERTLVDTAAIVVE